MDDEGHIGEPACVVVEFIGAQVFSSLEKAIEFIEEKGIDPELITVRQVFFTPLGVATQDVILQSEE